LKALIETSRRAPERVFLVGLELKSRTTWDLQDSLAELEELAATAGGEVIGNGTQKLDVPVASTFIGSGKADEFAAHCRQNKVERSSSTTTFLLPKAGT
jgi:GTP-binding protein HflX